MSTEKLIAAIPGQTKAQRDQMRANATNRLANGTPVQQAEAAAIIAAIDACEAQERVAFLGELSGLDVPERLIRTFTDAPMTDTEAKVLKALLDHPESSTEQLSAACGWKDLSWQLHFGTMCERRRAYLPPPTVYGEDNTPFWSGILADLDQREHPWKWTMKPEVAAALANLGLRPKKDA
ncbi:hypothetical protein [Sandarakinorhabdus rubra]|uniref:hypothetical protein n=1 Tax=Sandarakinorhabdus rubra TaxID=2672568 RepID=UPI0013DCA1EE|nr:hypothetical protein [Sandarakinorhabdus rubra]